MGQMVSIGLMLFILYQFFVYIKLDKHIFPIFVFPILIVFERILFYLYIVITDPSPNELGTTFSFFLGIQEVLYLVVLMNYLIKKKRLDG